MFRKLDLFPSSGEGEDTYSVGSLKELTSITGPTTDQQSRCLLPSPEDGNGSSFQNVVFSTL
jgi:hypothetical protein